MTWRRARRSTEEIDELPEIKSGDVVTLDPGEVKLALKATYLDGYTAEAEYPVKVSTWQERLMDWLQTTRWKLALGLAALVVALGYVFKRRFPKSMKAKPATTFRSKQFGQRPHEGRGRFTVAKLQEVRFPSSPTKRTCGTGTPDPGWWD